MHEQAEELDNDGCRGGGGLDDERDAAGPKRGAREGEGLAEQVVESELPGEAGVWGEKAWGVAAKGAAGERGEPLRGEERGLCGRYGLCGGRFHLQP